jgi:hypothetical protein
MHPSIARSYRPLILILPIVLIIGAVGLSGDISALARAGDASLEFVGHLIGGFHNFTLDRLAPTYPHCFN